MDTPKYTPKTLRLGWFASLRQMACDGDVSAHSDARMAHQPQRIRAYSTHLPPQERQQSVLKGWGVAATRAIGSSGASCRFFRFANVGRNWQSG